MNMVLTGTDAFARPEFKIARARRCSAIRAPVARGRRPGDALGRGLARHRVARRRARPTTRSGCWRPTWSTTRRRGARCAPGASCHDVHRAVSAGFTERGYHLGHVTGHSIGMTMIEFPKVGEGVETELAREHGASRCTRTRSPRTARTASTCRTRGSSRRTAACRSRDLPMQVSSCRGLTGRRVESERELAVARVARPRGCTRSRGGGAAPERRFGGAARGS